MELVWRIVGFVRTWYGGTATFGSVVLTAYYGVPHLLKTWDWYVDRWDGKVLRAVAQKPAPRYGEGIRIAPIVRELPHQTRDLVKQVGRSQKSVENSLKRLFDHGKVQFLDGGWSVKEPRKPLW
jgi:hypothetical protein